MWAGGQTPPSPFLKNCALGTLDFLRCDCISCETSNNIALPAGSEVPGDCGTGAHAHCTMLQVEKIMVSVNSIPNKHKFSEWHELRQGLAFQLRARKATFLVGIVTYVSTFNRDPNWYPMGTSQWGTQGLRMDPEASRRHSRYRRIGYRGKS